MVSNVAIPFPMPGDNQYTKCSSKRYLKAYGLRRGLRSYFDEALIVLIVLLAASTVVAYIFKEAIGQAITGGLAGSAAFLTLALGCYQCRQARHELSMDRYYDRLDIANRRRESGQMDVYCMMRHSSPEREENSLSRMMLVYAELDNLEYVIEKYRLGYMRPDQACRALRTFQRRCLSPLFRDLASKRVRAGDYNEATREVVKNVAKQAESLQKGKSPSQATDARVLETADRLTARLNEAWAAPHDTAQGTRA